MYKLIITELADSDLDGIINYISVDLSNTAAATDFLKEVIKCYEYLKKNPRIFSVSDDRRLAKEGYRKALIKNYVLAFKIDENTKTVTVYRFFYAARNYFKYL